MFPDLSGPSCHIIIIIFLISLPTKKNVYFDGLSVRHFFQQITEEATLMYLHGHVQTYIRWTLDKGKVQIFHKSHNLFVQPDMSGFISQGWALSVCRVTHENLLDIIYNFKEVMY